MLELHGFHCLGHAFGFLVIQGQGFSAFHITKTAAARANVPQDQEGGCPASPAFAHIGAVGFLANRMQLFAAHQVAQLGSGFSAGRFHFDPVWAAAGSGIDFFGIDPLAGGLFAMV